MTEDKTLTGEGSHAGDQDLGLAEGPFEEVTAEGLLSGVESWRWEGGSRN